MGFSNQFFKALGLQSEERKSIADFSRKTGIPLSRLRYYNDNNILPTGADLEIIVKLSGIGKFELMLKMGRLNNELLNAIELNSDHILSTINSKKKHTKQTQSSVDLAFQTKLGKLYKGDCLSHMKTMESNSVDLIFADPPFNLNKLYPSNIDDSLKTEKYIQWCQDWLSECVRILKNGGSLFLWNLPKWNALFTEYLGGRLNFRNWIAVDIKYSLPIQGRLYPSHYSLLYYVKGERPNAFFPDRLPMSTCPHCYGDLKDYGGYKNKMNPKGINLTDVWLDISPVRHPKYKRRNGANELSLKLLDRIIELASKEGDVVFDPFGGSGTTYMAAELKKRKWLGVEIGPVEDIVDRFQRIEEEKDILEKYRENINSLFLKKIHKKRTGLGLWTTETFNNNSEQKKAIIDVKATELTIAST